MATSPRGEEEMKDQVSRQVQAEMIKGWPRGSIPASHVLKRGRRQKAQEEQEDKRRGRRTEPARLYPQQAPDSKKLTQTKYERNQAKLPMRLGVGSRDSGRSRTKSLARHKAKLARTPEGTRASSEISEPVPCGKRCRRYSTLKGKQGLEETHLVCRRVSRQLVVH